MARCAGICTMAAAARTTKCVKTPVLSSVNQVCTPTSSMRSSHTIVGAGEALALAVRMQRKQQLLAGAGEPMGAHGHEEPTADQAAFQDDDDRVLRLKALEQLEGMMQPNMCAISDDAFSNDDAGSAACTPHRLPQLWVPTDPTGVGHLDQPR